MACLFAATVARAEGLFRTADVEGLRVTIDAEWVSVTSPGYLPVRLDITNRRNLRTIEIVQRGTRFSTRSRRGYGYSQGAMSTTQTLRLARGDRVHLTLAVPVFAENESMRFELWENGRLLESLGSMALQNRPGPGDAGILIVADGSSLLGQAAQSWPRPTFPGTVPGGGAGPARAVGMVVPTIDLILAPDRLPSNWLGFTSVRAVVIATQGWMQLTDEQRTALRTWVACGGDLIFVDGDPRTVTGGASPASGGSPDAGNAPPVVPHFLGFVHQISADRISSEGLGPVVTSLPAGTANWRLPADRAPGWNAVSPGVLRLSMGSIGRVRARAYLVILLFFSVIIGPVNYMFLRNRRRHVLLVLTAPLISVLFLLVLALYVVVGEGFGVHTRIASLTMLDEVRQQAVTRASVSLYAAGMTPRTGMSFPRDTAVFPLGGVDAAEDLTLDWTESQRFTSGLLRARTPANIETIDLRRARERLVFTRAADGISVVNGLGVNVTRLDLRTPDGHFVLDGPLTAGGRAALRARRTATPLVDVVHPFFTRFNEIEAAQPSGSYLATLERSPFLEPGVARVDERDSVHLLLGVTGNVP